jgi:hypothetical protein
MSLPCSKNMASSNVPQSGSVMLRSAASPARETDFVAADDLPLALLDRHPRAADPIGVFDGDLRPALRELLDRRAITLRRVQLTGKTRNQALIKQARPHEARACRSALRTEVLLQHRAHHIPALELRSVATLVEHHQLGILQMLDQVQAGIERHHPVLPAMEFQHLVRHLPSRFGGITRLSVPTIIDANIFLDRALLRSHRQLEAVGDDLVHALKLFGAVGEA